MKIENIWKIKIIN